ncbi:response regulator [Thalassobellus suaedae]|uniref:Response regulator n=1 Tax=Thalassobellus suaedae TaxID=3074124 RepID=A0ABY9Y2L1_9FLAO|nr:response regulator [Flavobacteriaceae bacterium HL-DH10]
MNLKNNIIMIIDDNEFDLYITSRLILSNHLADEVLEFDSGQLAINYLELNKDNLLKLPRLIFLDIYMPLMNGFQFIEQFKLLPTKVKDYCKICIVSSTVDDKYIYKAKVEENINLFTSKPITVDYIKSVL